MQEKLKESQKCSQCAAVIAELFQVSVAFMPTLYLLNVPFLDLSLGTVILILFLPFSGYYVWSWLKKEGLSIRKMRLAFPFVGFYLYLMIRSADSFSHMILTMATLVHLCGMLCGSVQAEKIRKMMVGFALTNAALVLIQTLAFYVLGLHIQYIPQILVHEQFRESYVFRELSGLYRPSALFLEPAHYAQYCCFALISVLFPLKGKANLVKAAIIAAGCVLTTSGMGIVLSLGIFLWYFCGEFLLSGRIKGFSAKQIVKWLVVFAVGAVLVYQIPFVKTAFARIFSTVDGYNAIKGRLGLWKWEDAIGTMELPALLFGYGCGAEYDYYLPGLTDTIYRFGIIGVALELCCFGCLMFKKRTHYVWSTCLTFLMLFVMARLTSFFVQVFYFGLVIADLVWRDEYAGKQGLSNEEIKKVGLGILSDVADFCEKNGIEYCLVCGTALGAVRHNGFIPWDDDIDIGMPREDYERFLESYRSENYRLCDTRFDRKYPYAFAKVCDNQTVLLENIADPCDMGVYIDVFPIDGLPEDEALRRQHIKRIDWDMRLIAWKRISWDKKVGAVHKIIQVLAKSILYVIPMRVLVRKLDNDVKRYPYAKSRYVGHMVTKAIWGSDVKPREMFENPVAHVFEDREFRVPGQVNAYLRQEYGDYMQLPPEDKRVAKHDFIAYYK